jgi:hypothetical protein
LSLPRSIFALLVAVAAVGGGCKGRGDGARVVRADAALEQRQQGACPDGMVEFHGGAFRMGTKGADEPGRNGAPPPDPARREAAKAERELMLTDETPVHEVTLSPFCLDRLEAAGADGLPLVKVTRDVARIMAEQRSGTMILMTSDRGVHGSIDFAHYAAAKGGMIALAKSLALNMGKFGVTVNGINPGMTDTPLARGGNPQWKEKQALDVLGTHSLPEEIAEIVLFLASTAGRFMTGQIVSTRMRHGA